MLYGIRAPECVQPLLQVCNKDLGMFLARIIAILYWLAEFLPMHYRCIYCMSCMLCVFYRVMYKSVFDPKVGILVL